MHNQFLLERLRAELIRRGLPIKYVQRTVAELQDHRRDILDEFAGDPSRLPDANQVADGRLGDQGQLADAVVHHYRCRTFWGRHPVLTFIIAPIPTLVLAWLAAFLGIWSLMWLVPDDIVHESFGVPLFRMVDFLLIYGVPAAVTALLCRAGYRHALGWPWVGAACLLVGLLAFSLFTTLEPPTAGPGSGRYTVGLAFGWQQFASLLAIQQLTQLLAPLTVGACFLFGREMHVRRQLAAELPSM